MNYINLIGFFLAVTGLGFLRSHSNAAGIKHVTINVVLLAYDDQ